MAEPKEYTIFEFNTGAGPIRRKVSTAPPRKPTDDEIPIIDLGGLSDTLSSREACLESGLSAAELSAFDDSSDAVDSSLWVDGGASGVSSGSL